MAALARENWQFLLLLLVVVLLRVSLLLTSQYGINSDEAVIGLMAKRILDEGAFPVYYQGQPYNGGGAIEAYLAAAVFAVFGVSTTALKSVAVFLSLLAVPAVYALALRATSRQWAVLAAALFAFAPSLAKWHFQVRGGYLEMLVLIPVIALTLHRIVTATEQRTGRFFALGLLAGVAVWNSELILPFLLCGALLLLAAARGALRVRYVLAAASAAALGAGPSIVFNLTHGWSNVRYLLNRIAAPVAHDLVSPNTLRSFLTAELPRFFSTDTVWWYEFGAPVPFYAWAHYVAFWSVLIAGAFLFRRPLWLLARQLFTRRNTPRQVPLTFPALLLLLFVVLHLAVVLRPQPAVPSYVLPILPGMAILTALMLGRLASRGAWPKRLAATAAAVLLGTGLWASLSLFGKPEVESLPVASDGLRHKFEGHADSVRHLIRFLDARGIRYVFAPYYIQFRLIFESNERVVASSQPFEPYSIFPRYEHLVEAEGASCVIVELHSSERQRIAHTLREGGMTFDTWEVAEFTVLLMSRPVGPGERRPLPGSDHTGSLERMATEAG